MRLLFINSSLGSGGAERQMVRLLELINNRGIVPFVLTYSDMKSDYPTDAKMKRINVSKKHKLIRNISLVSEIIKIRPEVILSYCGDPNILACIYKRLNNRCRVIVSERNIASLPLSKASKKYYKLISVADHIVSNSHSQAEFIQRFYPEYSDKLSVITNYTEVPSVIPPFKEPSFPIVVSVFARYHKNKNTLRFIEAISTLSRCDECPPFIVNWYGRNTINGVESDYYRQCKSYAEALGVSNINLWGFSNETNKMMLESDIICLPSLKEGFSNSLSEALCLGKPILASDVSDNRLFVSDGINGHLFDPTSVSDMSAKIKLILREYSSYNDYRKASYQIAQNLFNKESFVNDYIKLFGEE